MKKIIIVLAMVLVVSFAFGQTIGSAPTVSGVLMVQTGGIVTVTYNLSYTLNETYSTVTFALEDADGKKYYPNPAYFEAGGDFGIGVATGINKQIRWNIRAQYNAGGEYLSLIGYKALIIAKRDDNYNPATYNPDNPALSVPAGMVFVQGTAGVTFSPGGLGYFRPGGTYDVSLSSFYISQFAVTQDEWTAVMSGIYDPSWTAQNGLGPNHPAYNISWFDTIEYCNRRSMMEGLTPCYSYTDGDGSHGTNPDDWPAGWNTNYLNHTNVSCNWETDGYRLPTEMEREFAARGGVPAATAETPTFNSTYAGTNDAGQLGEYAWHGGNSSDGTKAVGTKLPNELGLYDMSGNVWDWVWDITNLDWWSLTPYPTGPHNNPKGAPSGNSRVLRGGSWHDDAGSCRVDLRNGYYATLSDFARGIRVSRNLN